MTDKPWPKRRRDLSPGGKATPRLNEKEVLEKQWWENHRANAPKPQRGDDLASTLERLARVTGSEVLAAAHAEIRRLDLDQQSFAELRNWLAEKEHVMRHEKQKRLHEEQLQAARRLFGRGHSQEQAARHIAAQHGMGTSFDAEVRRLEQVFRDEPSLQGFRSIPLAKRRRLGRRFEFGVMSREDWAAVKVSQDQLIKLLYMKFRDGGSSHEEATACLMLFFKAVVDIKASFAEIMNSTDPSPK